MTQATQIIVPMLVDAVGILPYHIAMTSTINLGNVVLANTATSTALGFALLGVTGELGIDPSSIGDLTVAGVGYLKIAQIGLPIASPITANGFGQGVVANTTGQRYVGFLLEPATALGQICKILVCPGIL